MRFDIYICVFIVLTGFTCQSGHVVEVQRRPQIPHPGCESVRRSRGHCHSEPWWRGHHLEAGDARTGAPPAESDTESVRKLNWRLSTAVELSCQYDLIFSIKNLIPLLHPSLVVIEKPLDRCEGTWCILLTNVDHDQTEIEIQLIPFLVPVGTFVCVYLFIEYEWFSGNCTPALSTQHNWVQELLNYTFTIYKWWLLKSIPSIFKLFY